MTTRASLQRRLFLGALVWIVAALAVTGVVLSILFRSHLQHELARRLDADFVQLVSQLEVGADGALSHPQAMSDPLYARVLSGRYWQVEAADAGRTPALLRSRSLWGQRLAARAIAGDDAPYVSAGPRGARLLTLTREITLPRRSAGLRVTVAASLQPLEAAVGAFRATLAIALGVLAIGLVAAAALQVWLGLRPLRRLRAELAAIRGARANRIDGDYPGEVAPLVADLNQVLDDNDMLVARARRQASNLAHALKTPLSVLANEADRRGAQETPDHGARMHREIHAMRRQIDWHLAHARMAVRQRHGETTPVASVIERLARTLQRLYGARGTVIDARCDARARFAGEAQDLEQMIGNLLDNACKWARGVVEVRARAGERLCLRVDDDGPGLAPDQRAQALDRGRRFDEAVPGSGLGLAIVVDLAAAYGGTLTLARADLGGVSARLDLPGGPPDTSRWYPRAGG